MGLFSWCCAISDKSIPAENTQVVVVLPDSATVTGTYNGYGSLEGPVARDSSGNEIDLEALGVVLDQGQFDIHCAYGSHLIEGFYRRDDAFTGNAFEIIENAVKMVYAPYYRGHRYEDLSVSQSCPFQGFFVPDEPDEDDDEEGFSGGGLWDKEAMEYNGIDVSLYY